MTAQAELQTTRHEMQVMEMRLLTPVKKIVIKHNEPTFAEFPLTIGVIGVMLALAP